MIMWVLLQYFNSYDQEGGYFAGIFPSYEECEGAVDHLGRVNWENSWYEAHYCKVGTVFPPIDDKKTVGFLLRNDSASKNCRNRLRAEGKTYPKSGCEICGSGGLTGCTFGKE